MVHSLKLRFWFTDSIMKQSAVGAFNAPASLWTRTRQGALRHVSGLSISITERPGRRGAGSAFIVTPDPTTFQPWQEYEKATGTSFTALNKRMSQLQGEALTCHQSDLGRGA